ncbi:hypothetical protein Adt_03610 [Abeliophyllum distichum]|uniref:Uncharacterized protein n=1 Tax=Abeliophyllum distichum TaxID=126358 RepID=A0ABD1VZ96_9LAMI
MRGRHSSCREEVFGNRSLGTSGLRRETGTQYFHLKASNRQSKNALWRLQDGILEGYFGSIFRSGRPSVEELEAGLTGISTRLLVEDIDWLEKPCLQRKFCRLQDRLVVPRAIFFQNTGPWCEIW